jgi:cytochrome c553
MIAFALLLFLSTQQLFNQHCAGCHGADARGTAKGPGLATNPRIAEQSAEQLTAFIERGNVANGMPSFADLSAHDRMALAKYLRVLNMGTVSGPPKSSELAPKISWRPPQPGDWLTYNGDNSANRYSPLKQIDMSNVSSLAEVDFSHSVLRPGDDAAGRGRRALCYRSESGLCAGRPYWRGLMALLACSQQWNGWGCQTRN